MKQLKTFFFFITIIFSLLLLTSCIDEKVSVKFDLNYEDKILEIIEIKKNSQVNEPDEPTRTGYIFAGWYNNDSVYDFSLEVKENLTLKALWDVKTFTVSFDLLDISEQNINYNEKAIKPNDPTKEGYRFLGWYNGLEEFDFKSPIIEDINLTPKWDKIESKTLKVTFVYSDDDIKIEELEQGSILQKPINPTKEGYMFIGWFLNDHEYDFNLEVTKDITLYAYWEKTEEQKDFFVAFNSNGGNYNPEVSYLNEGEYLNEPIKPTKEGYMFIGWFDGDNLVSFPLRVYDNYLLVAQWKEIATNKMFISEFRNIDYKSSGIISGVITSFGLYNYLTIEDETGAVLLRISANNTNDLKTLGYQLGNRLTVYATKGYINNLLIAEANLNLVIKDEVINNRPNSVDITNLDSTQLYNYDARLVIHDSLLITNIYEESNKLIFTLKSDELILNAIYDTRYLFDSFISLYDFQVYDIVKISDIVLVYDTTSYVAIESLSQIEKIGEETVLDDQRLFKIFYLNDTHGSVLQNGSEMGLARIGNYIKNESDENSIFITGGDMLQGELISNANRGAIIIEILNNLNLDAFVIGNHEFDWGLGEVLKYFDPKTTTVKANFPILGANVKRKSDNQRPDFIDSHVIIKRGSYNIGIIGVIGDNLESSISRLMVEDYYFSDAYSAVSETVNEIKNQVDFILVVNHHSDSNFNNRVANLPKVKAIFNGHTHRAEQGYTNGVPYIQSGSNGKMIGKVELLINKENGLTVKNSNINNVTSSPYLNSEDEEINFIIASYYEQIRDLYEEEILSAKRDLSQNELAYFIAELMAKKTNSVFALQNSGGTRASIYQGPITGSDVFKVFPFDNRIISVRISGSDLKKLYNRETYIYLEGNINSINNSSYYNVATNDYVFYSNYNKDVFEKHYNQITVYGDLYEAFYDYLVALKNDGKTYFDPNDEVVYPLDLMFIYKYYDKKEDLINYNYN